MRAGLGCGHARDEGATSTETNTWYAQGGIAGAVGEADSVELHLADTLVVGQGLCDEAVVRAVVGEAADALADLAGAGRALRPRRGRRGRARARGRAQPAARAALRRRHRRRGTEHALGGRAPHPRHRALRGALPRRPAHRWRTAASARSCWTARSASSRCFWADAVVLATGGAGQVYRVTTNPVDRDRRRRRRGVARGRRDRRPGVRAVPPHRARQRRRPRSSSSPRRCAARAPTCSTATSSASCSASTRSPSSPRATS